MAVDESRNKELAGPMDGNTCVGTSRIIHYIARVEADSPRLSEVQTIKDTNICYCSPGLRTRFGSSQFVVPAWSFFDGMEWTSRGTDDCQNGQKGQK